MLYSNTVFIIHDSTSLCYERDNLNGVGKIKERVANNLESSPKVCSINLFKFAALNTNELKIDYLKKIELPVVSED